MEDIFARIRDTGLVPVIQIEDADDAVPLAKALLAGGIDIAEVTYRTAAAEESIRRIHAECPDMLVLAGTVLNTAQAQSAVQAGAAAIVSPGYDEETVSWCADRGIPILPGVSSATEVQHAVRCGLTTLKFFPAESSGGTAFLDAMRGPFPGCRFMPTGGISMRNAGEYARRQNVIAVSGSWLCTGKDIREKAWQRITDTCRESLLGIQGFEFAHVGINTQDQTQAQDAAKTLGLFGFAPSENSQSIFSGSSFEIMKYMGRGTHGHIGIMTNSIERALRYLSLYGYKPVAGTEQYAGEKGKSPLSFVYVDVPLQGFDVHLKRKA